MANLREWAPLTDLFNLLPTKVQSGLFSSDVKLTCIDVLPDFLALGTNFGLVYWYDRKKNNLEKLRCENSRSCITVVKIASTVDYMVASGNADGNVNIFQVPISHPESLPISLRPKSKQVERYTVSELHGGPITALEWSKNGMKLFSGDKIGRIVLTELDFNMHLCRSIEIINESYEVVQISCYLQNLLVSTTYRSIICKKEDKWKVAQIGKTDRKVLDKFGGTFYQNGPNPKDVILYCTRPGLRIWISDTEGNVQKTLLFKEIIAKPNSQIPLINPIALNMKQPREPAFGILIPFNDLLITYNNDVLYILDPKSHTINLAVYHLRRILSVAVNKDEIFILEGERSLIRLGNQPEHIYESHHTSASDNANLNYETNNGLPAIIPFLSNLDLIVHTDTTSVTNAEEAIELSPSHTIKPAHEAIKKLEVYAKISNEEFDDNILYKPKPKGRKKSSAAMSSASSEDQESSVSKATLMNISTVGILPDLRSKEDIAQDIENKEKLLATVLCFDNLLKAKSKESRKATQELNKRKIEIPVLSNELRSDESVLSSEVKINESKTSNLVEQVKEMNSEERCEAKEGVVNSIKNISRSVNKPSKNLQVDEVNSFVTVPACTSVPTDWNLKKVQIKEKETKIINRSESEDLPDDWEMI